MIEEGKIRKESVVLYRRFKTAYPTASALVPSEVTWPLFIAKHRLATVHFLALAAIPSHPTDPTSPSSFLFFLLFRPNSQFCKKKSALTMKFY